MYYIKTFKSTNQKLKLAITLIFFSSIIWGQSIISESDVINMAMTKNPSMTASLLTIKKNQQLENASFNLDNPNVMWESPSGEFMTFGISQTIAFPTVYSSQKKLAKANTNLSKRASDITKNEIHYFLKLQYLNVQFARSLVKELEKQKDALSAIYTSGKRQFDIGDIDYVSMTYASSQYGEILNEYQMAVSEASEAESQLKLYTAIEDSLIVSKLNKRDSDILLSIDQINSPNINYLKQGEVVANQEYRVEKNKALPGFAFGYQNQGDSKDTPNHLRFSAGLSFPLWFWQYSASMKAAKTNIEVASETTKAEELNIKSQWNKLKSDALKYLSSIQYYEKTGLGYADGLISASKRMFDVGQTDYITYLRTLRDAHDIQIKYLDAINFYNQSIIKLEFLNGKN